MAKSTCVAKKHSEYDCLIKWSVSKRKYLPKQWCEPCKEKHKKYIDEGRFE